MANNTTTPYRSADAAVLWSIADVHREISPQIGVSRFVASIPPDQVVMGGPRWKSSTVRDFQAIYFEKWLCAGYRCQVTADEVQRRRDGLDVRLNKELSKE